MSITGAIGAAARPLGMDEDDLRLLAAGIDVRKAALDLKFTKSLYRLGSVTTRSFKALPGASYTGNAGLLTRTNSAGVVLPPGPANEPGETDVGLDVWEARTNKCVNVTFNPTDATRLTKFGDAAAVLSVVDDSAALAAAGLSSICTNGKVFKLDNSAGASEAGAACWGQAGNTNPHSNSAYVRGGAGSIRETWSGQGVNFAAAGAYRRIVAAGVSPGNATSEMSVRADAGQIVYFILNIREESASASSYIPTTTATATRTAIAPVIATSIGGDQDFTIFVEVELVTMARASNETLFSWDDGTVGSGSSNNRVRVLRSVTDSIFGQVAVGGPATGLGSAAAKGGARILKAAFRRVAGKCRLGVDGVWLANESAALEMPALSFLRIGHSSPGSETVNARVRRLIRLPGMSDAQVLAMTA